MQSKIQNVCLSDFSIAFLSQKETHFLWNRNSLKFSPMMLNI